MEPNSVTVLRTGNHAASLVTTSPSITSECPLMYLVAAWTETSTPRSNERKKYGVPHVLSAMTTAPCACATAAIAGMSCISNVSEPGASQNTTRVLGFISAATPEPTSG